jgi:hypothetical protein
MSKPIQWLLAILLPLGFGPLVLRVVSDTPLAHWVSDVVLALLLQPVFRLSGMTEAAFWKFMAVVAIVTAVLIPVPRTRLDLWVVLGILAVASAMGLLRLMTWIRARPRRT